MGEVSEEENTKTWLSVIWRVCNLLMSLFFALAAYVQVSVVTLGWVFFWGGALLLFATNNQYSAVSCVRSMTQTQGYGW